MAEEVNLMLNNAKTFNEDTSQIYHDAETLGLVFADSMRQLGPTAVESPKLLKVKYGWVFWWIFNVICEILIVYLIDFNSFCGAYLLMLASLC